MTCPACTSAFRAPGDVGFIAGIAFGLQFNNEAIKRRLCSTHANMLIRGVIASVNVKIPPEDVRKKE